LVADLTIVGVPLIVQFVVLKVSPVSVVRFGEILQEEIVPVTVGVLEVRAVLCVNTKGDPE
jgi:hypothetical protein